MLSQFDWSVKYKTYSDFYRLARLHNNLQKITKYPCITFQFIVLRLSVSFINIIIDMLQQSHECHCYMQIQSRMKIINTDFDNS